MHPHLDCYLVGGAVRDMLLGLDPKDKDYCVVGANDSDMLAFGFKHIESDFPIYLHPVTREEYALARLERKVAPGYNGFEMRTEDVTLEQDLSRRDLTINAMAIDKQGNLIDPFNGEKDLKDGILRHVGPAFSEDPVRVLRVCRFAARYNFTIATETKELMKKMVQNGELNHLTKERVMLEFSKVSEEKYLYNFFTNLKEVGALDILGKFEQVLNPLFEKTLNESPTVEIKNFYIFADFNQEEMHSFGVPKNSIDYIGYIRKWKPVSTFYTYMNNEMKLQFLQDTSARHNPEKVLEVASAIMYTKDVPCETADFEIHKIYEDVMAIKNFDNKAFIDELNRSHALKSLKQSDKNAYIHAELKNKYASLLFTHKTNRMKP